MRNTGKGKPMLGLLFSPVRIGTLELKSGPVMPAMMTCFAGEEEHVSERQVAYLLPRQEF